MRIEKLEEGKFKVIIKGVDIILTKEELINLGKVINDITTDWHTLANPSLNHIVTAMRVGKGFKMRIFSDEKEEQKWEKC